MNTPKNEKIIKAITNIIAGGFVLLISSCITALIFATIINPGIWDALKYSQTCF